MKTNLKFSLLSLLTANALAAPRPNIIFILCDDLGYGDVGVFYQNQRAALKDPSVPFFSTPHIDSLAKEGVMLTQHYGGAPVCASSRASLLAGLTQGHASVRDNQFDKALADSHTLGTLMRQAGYATAAFGKWGLQGKSRKSKDAEGEKTEATGGVMPESWTAYPTKRGFDDFFGYVRHVDGHFHYPKEDKIELWENDREVSADLDKCYTTDLFTARAKKWITEQNSSTPQKPFFIFLAYDTPHAKLQNPPSAYPAGGGLKGGVQWTGKPHAMINSATGEYDGYMFPDYAAATWDHDKDAATPQVPWPDVQKRYANSVRRIDFAVGDVIQLLKDLKIDDNTLIVFTSDNGPSQESKLTERYEPTFFRGFGPFEGIKRDTWEGGSREPTLARWPGGIPAGRVNAAASGQWDWLATFSNLAGLPAPAASDGVSLMPSLTGKGKQAAGTLYIEYSMGGRTPDYKEFDPSHQKRQRGQMQVIHVDGHKGIRYDLKSANDDFEIYDLAKDPRELDNLAKKPAFAELQAAMKACVLQVRKPAAELKRPYDNALVPPIAQAPPGSPGLTWALFKGEWPWLPDFRTLTPADTGTSPQVELSMASTDPSFGVAFTGYFHAKADGEYNFTLGSDTAAMLFLHDIRVIDEPMRNAAGKFTGRVHLKSGWHPIRLYYRHAGDSKPELILTCRQGAGGDYPLNPDVFRTEAASR
jgi:arylsulfatase A-like enzyme